MARSTTASFSAPAQMYMFDGLLSDFDGTILDSTNGIVKFWHSIGAEMNVNPNTILATSHGRRTIDTIGLYDPSKANWDYVNQLESRIPLEFGTDATDIPGSAQLLTALETSGAKWGVVTSATRSLIQGWIDMGKMINLSVLVTAEDVGTGKPDPQGYHLGRKRLELGDSTSIIVLEDAPSGIKAGKAAGFKVLAVQTSHSVEALSEARPDWIVKDLRSVTVKRVDSEGRVEIEIRNALL